jgi:hypothetical protein
MQEAEFRSFDWIRRMWWKGAVPSLGGSRGILCFMYRILSDSNADPTWPLKACAQMHVMRVVIGRFVRD